MHRARSDKHYFETLSIRSVILLIMLWIKLMTVSNALLKVSINLSTGMLLSSNQKMPKKETKPPKPNKLFT